MWNETELAIAAIFSRWILLLSGCLVTVLVGLGEKFLLKRSLSRAPYALILGLLLVWAAVGAWKDEHRNLQTVIKEKANTVGSLNECREDYRFASERAQLWEQQTGREQSLFDEDRSSLDRQQATLNTCVTALTVRNSPESLKTRVIQFTVPDQTHGPGQKLYLLVVTSNKTIEAKGLLKCPTQIQFADSPFFPMDRVSMLNTETALKDRGIYISLSPARITPSEPLLIFVFAYSDPVGCTFEG